MMKYLRDELYGVFGDEKKTKEWWIQRKRLDKEFKRIQKKFPQSFVEEILEGNGFHDSHVLQFLVDAQAEKSNLRMTLEDGFEPEARHIIFLQNIEQLTINDFLLGEWLYCEVLPQKRGRFSLEVMFSNNGSLYIEFEKLDYIKGITNDSAADKKE